MRIARGPGGAAGQGITIRRPNRIRSCGVTAVGRSMRFSLVAVVVVVMLASLALYGVDPNFNLTV